MGTELKNFEVWARRRRISNLGVILAAIFIIFTSTSFLLVKGARVPGVERECNSIANMIKGKGFTYPWWVGSGSGGGGVLGSHSSPANSSTAVCPIGKSGERSTKCCKELDASIQKTEMSSAFNEKWLGPKLTANGDIFKERKKKFDVTFKDLLTRAHAAFHAMFERTYGMLYIQHAPIFHALFTTLEAYYDTGRDSLEGKLNEFFAILTRKMFVVLNSQYEFDDAYLSCATIVITEKQGGDLHRQIVSSLRRSFVATRALAQGLNDADRVFNNLHKLKMSPECISSLSHMLQCPICTELRAYKPCSPLCTGITSQCLSATTPLVKAWTEFTNAMENILDRLLGPYNVEAVVEPIHIKISEAIMNFQESGPDLSQAVFAKCGKAKLKSAKNFRKREAVQSEPVPENLRRRPDEVAPKNGMNGGSLQADTFRANTGHDDTQPSKSLEKLLREVKNKVKKSKNIWEILPRQVCNGISKDYSSQLCWNGTLAMKPDKNKTNENSNFRSLGKGTPNILVSEQIIILQQITEKLRASFNGLDVQWVQENDDLDFGGSGMGSGSGEFPTDLEDSDDDDPSGQIKPDRRPPPSNANTNFHPPSHPKFPVRPPPPILKPLPNHEDEEEEEEEDDTDDNDDIHSTNNNVNWNTGSSNPTDIFGNNNNNRGGGGGFSMGTDDDDGIDFVPSQPKYVPPMTVPDAPTTTTTTTTTTTRRPIDVTKKKHPSTSSGTMDEAKKVVAFFKLFSPIFASMVGKAFSFT